MSYFLDIALQYAARGWFVHPLRVADKIPIVKDWPNQAAKDEAQIRAWWAENPNANVGIACRLSGLTVYDGDHGFKCEADFFAWCERNGIPRTYTVHSGRRFSKKETRHSRNTASRCTSLGETTRARSLSWMG